MYFKGEEDWQKKLIKDIAEKYGIDIRIVRQMVYYPFLFTKEELAKTESKKPIRHRQLGVFLVKKRFEDKFNETNEIEIS
jgi:hypothetical protein